MAMGKNRKRAGLLICLAVVLSLALGCGAYVNDYYPAEEGAVAHSEMEYVEISENRVVFAPEDPRAGLIFYPGGKVEFTAYAPLMAALAEEEILCVLLKMPLNLAVLDMDAAKGVPEEFPEVEHWYLAGHSLGGSMAASFAAGEGENYEGLILLASYSTADLTQGDLRVLSVYGDRDGVLNREKYEQYRENLPESTVELVLEGANHAGFGAYGPQEGDGEAAISRQEQQEKTVEAICGFLLAQLAPAD